MGLLAPGCSLVLILSRTPDKPKSSVKRRRQVVRRREPGGVGIAVHPSAVTSVRDAQHPLDQLAEVRLIAPRHSQPQFPIVASHARQVHCPSYDAHFRPSTRLHFEVTMHLAGRGFVTYVGDETDVP